MTEITVHKGEIDTLKNSLTELLQEQTNASSVFEQYGRDGLLQHIESCAPDFAAELQESNTELLKGTGFVAVRGLGIEHESPELAKLIAITTSAAYGTPTYTDSQSQHIAWPVHHDPNAVGRKTFSQTMEEAQFHTDSQYAAEPENAFGLYCVTPDMPGKGTNTLIAAEDILTQLQEQEDVISSLRLPFPFRVPSVFTQNGKDEKPEVTWAPIVTDRLFRFRKDTLEDGIEAVGEISREQRQALSALNKAIQDAPKQTKHLQAGEALIVNNHTMLHARTPYDNPHRLLYRVRTRA